MLTTTRRGWRSALDSSLLFAVVVCGSASALLAAAPAAAVVAGRVPAVASIGPGAALVAPGPGGAGAVDKGSTETSIVAAGTVALSEPGPRLTWTSESILRDSADDDDDDDNGDNDDDGALEHSPAPAPARGIETRHLTDIDLDPSLFLESDGHSLRAPPQ
jgi:hypothetical protein